jgi:hypothetical protein
VCNAYQSQAAQDSVYTVPWQIAPRHSTRASLYTEDVCTAKRVPNERFPPPKKNKTKMHRKARPLERFFPQAKTQALALGVQHRQVTYVG